MLPYWLLFSIFAAGSIESRRREMVGAQAAPFLAVAGLFVALMIGLRYEVGGDWINYENIYIDYRYRDLWQTLTEPDPGFGLLNWLGNWMGVKSWFVNLICAAIFSWGLIKFAAQQTNPWLTVLIAVPYLIIVVAMGYTRQAVAIGLIFAGLAVVERTSLLRFSAYIVLAATFHKSAIVVLPLIGLAASRQRVVMIPMLGATILLVYYLFVSASVDTMMANYVEAEMSSQGAVIRVAMNLPPAILYLLLSTRFGISEQQHKIWRNFALASLLAALILVFTSATTAVDRLSLYLIPLQMFVLGRLPQALGHDGRRNSQVAVGLIAYSALIQFVWLTYAQNADFWIPYQIYPFFEQA